MRARQNIDVEARAAAMAHAALGKRLKVRLQPERSMHSYRDTIEGEIVEASFAYWKQGAWKSTAVFKVVIEAGVTKTRRIVHVTKLPR